MNTELFDAMLPTDRGHLYVEETEKGFLLGYWINLRGNYHVGLFPTVKEAKEALFKKDDSTVLAFRERTAILELPKIQVEKGWEGLWGPNSHNGEQESN